MCSVAYTDRVVTGSPIKRGARRVVRAIVPARIRRTLRPPAGPSDAQLQALVAENHRLNHLVGDLYDKLAVLADHLPAVLNSISVQNDASRRAARIEGALQERLQQLETHVQALSAGATDTSIAHGQ
jgi:hypothetical protein